MSVQLCPTCGRRPSERIGVTTDMVNECGYEIEARYPTHACPDPIHDFADTHAAEVARLTAAGQALRDATDVLVVGGDPQVGGSPELIRAMNAWDAIAPAARKETKDQ